MTTTPGASEAMTAERLDRMRKWVAAIPADNAYLRHTTGADACQQLLDHIDAQAAEIAALKAERDDAVYIAREQGSAHVAANLRCAEVECERDALKAELATARNDALEEAATFIEGLKLPTIWGRHAIDEFLHRASETATAIRAMKGPTP